MMQLDKSTATQNAEFIDSILNRVLGIPTSQAKPYHPAQPRTLELGTADATIHLSSSRLTITLGKTPRTFQVSQGAWGRLATVLDKFQRSEIDRAEAGDLK